MNLLGHAGSGGIRCNPTYPKAPPKRDGPEAEHCLQMQRNNRVASIAKTQPFGSRRIGAMAVRTLKVGEPWQEYEATGVCLEER